MMLKPQSSVFPMRTLLDNAITPDFQKKSKQISENMRKLYPEEVMIKSLAITLWLSIIMINLSKF